MAEHCGHPFIHVHQLRMHMHSFLKLHLTSPQSKRQSCWNTFLVLFCLEGYASTHTNPPGWPTTSYVCIYANREVYAEGQEQNGHRGQEQDEDMDEDVVTAIGLSLSRVFCTCLCCPAVSAWLDCSSRRFSLPSRL